MRSESPFISIIIPSIGRETLEKVLWGLVECNSFENISLETILVFDLEEELAKIQISKIKSIKNTQSLNLQYYFTGKTKSGSSKTRNIGLDKAKGEVVAFLQDDTVPVKDWLTKTVNFHKKSQDNKALLGKVEWPDDLKSDPFHAFLENNFQFDFKNLETKKPSWRHFYTSNISLKRKFLADQRFDVGFQKWGFEDSELGYRLVQKGLVIEYDKECRVQHLHPQTLEGVKKNMEMARINAKHFEEIHPEVKILPRAFKKILLRTIIILLTPLRPFSNRISWWCLLKNTWLNN